MKVKYIFLLFLLQFVFEINLHSQILDSTLEYKMQRDSILTDSIVLPDSLNTDTIAKIDTVFNVNDTLKVFRENWSNSNIFPYRTGAAPKVPDSLPIVLVDS